MKCSACGHENIYGSTTCKQCGASLTAVAQSAPATPTVAPVEQSAPVAAPTPTYAASPATAPAKQAEAHQYPSYPSELTFIPYIGNEQFNYFLRVLRRSFDFNTRSTRAEFWWYSLFEILIAIAIVIILPFLSPLYSLLLMIPSIAVMIRRLHDINKSGWWLLILFVPLIGAIILLIFMVKETQQAENQWGAVPAI